MKSSKYKIGSKFLAISIGVVYLWFGVLKFFPHLSPAEDLAKNTIDMLDFGLIPSKVSILLLAIWETGIGLLLVFNLFRRWALGFAIVHIVLTFTPMFFFPEQIFNNGPFNLTLLGQYIVKNIVIFSILVSLFIQSTGTMVPKIAKESKSDHIRAKRAVQYSWQAQRVANSNLEIVSAQKSLGMAENQY